MIYYRVALQIGQAQTWQWRSTPLTSLQALQTFLRAYSTLPQQRVRVFFSSSGKDMDAMLLRQNEGQMSSSVTADQFLTGKPTLSSLEIARLELELGVVGDHDTEYVFSLPSSLPQLISWMRLMLKVRSGELES